MNERRTSRSPYRVRVHAGSDLPTRHAVTAALMAAFFLMANGLALAWTLTNHNPHMRHGFVVAMIGSATALFPVVETETQLARVQELGCDLVQGYLFSKAVPPDQLTRLLRADPWRRVLTIHG
jgi:hypothetical protein